MDLLSLFSNHLIVFQDETKQKRQVNNLLAAGAATILAPTVEVVDFKLFSIFGARVSLTKGLIPVSFLTPPQIRDNVSKLEQTGWFPAISKSQMSLNYDFRTCKKRQNNI